MRTSEVSTATVACLPCFGVDVQGFAGEHSCLSAKKDTSGNTEFNARVTPPLFVSLCSPDYP